jgi:hypothetical protein
MDPSFRWDDEEGGWIAGIERGGGTPGELDPGFRRDDELGLSPG